MMDYSLQSELFHTLFRIFQDTDGDTAAPVLAHIYTPPVFDGDGSTATVFATIGGSATANLLYPYTAN